MPEPNDTAVFGASDSKQAEPDFQAPPEAAEGPLEPVEGFESQTPTPEGGQPVTEEDKVADRLKKQNARQAKLLAALGVDPLSDIAEQLENGLITEEMVKEHISKQYRQREPDVHQMARSEPDELSMARSQLEEARQAFEKEMQSPDGVDAKTYEKYQDAKFKLGMAEMQDKIMRQVTAEKMQRQVDESVNEVVSLARTAPEYSKMPEECQSELEQLYVSHTSFIAGQLARQNGWDPNTLSPQQYRYCAGQAQERLGRLSKFYYEMGAQDVRNGISRNPSNKNVNIPPPAGPSGTPALPPNPYSNVNLRNHKDAALHWAKQNGIM